VGDITLAPNGTTNDIRLYKQPADNSSAGTEILHNSGAHVFQPSISPDGTKLCYTLSLAAGNSTTASVVAAPLSNPSSITVIESSGKGDYNCTWSPDGTKIAYTEDYAGNGEIYMKASDGSGIPFDLTNTPGTFDGNPDWAPDGRPTCPDKAVSTNVNTAVQITVTCTDTGPAYEQTEVREFAKTKPSHGTLTQEQEQAGKPFVYTPNAGFTGTDSFEVGSFDEFGFGSDTGTVTITVQEPKKGGGPKKKGKTKGKGKAGAFGAKTNVTIALAARRIPAGGPLKVLVTNKNKFAITGRLSGKRKHVKLRAKRFSIAAKAKKTVRLRLPKPLQRVLKRKHQLTIRLRAAVRDPSGNLRIVTKTVRPKLKS
jgi:hypothetical protein